MLQSLGAFLLLLVAVAGPSPAAAVSTTCRSTLLTVYPFSAKKIDGSGTINFADLAGKVVIVTNVATY